MPAMMLVGGAALGGAGSIISGIFGASAAKKQAEAIRYASDQARKTALEIDDKQRTDLAPFRQYGITAGDSLTGMLTGGKDVSQTLKASPLYEFQSQMGNRDITRQLAARGMQHSGAGLETLQKFTNQLVAEEGNRFYDRLFNLTQLGSNAAAHTASNTAQIGSNLMQTQGQLGIQAAQIAGGADRAWGNSIGGFLSGAGQTLAQYPMYQASMNMLNSYGRMRGNDPVFDSRDSGGLSLAGR